jgi:hypothetical protein
MIFTPSRASAPANSLAPTLHLSRRRSSLSTLWFPQRQPPQRCQRQGPSRGSSLPTSRPSSLLLRTQASSPTTPVYPPSVMTSTPPRLQCWRRQLTRRSRFTSGVGSSIIHTRVVGRSESSKKKARAGVDCPSRLF